MALHGRFWWGDAPDVIRTPGYPLLLVPGLWGGLAVVVGLQILLSCATCYLAYLTARRLADDERAAALAALLCAFEPLGVLHSVLLLSETLFTLLVVAALYLLIRAFSERKLIPFTLAAVCFAAAAYVRPVAYFLPLVLAPEGVAYGLRRKDGRLVAGVALCFAVSFGLTAAWQWRNARVADYAGFSAVGDFNAYFHLTAALKSEREGRPFYDCLRELGFYDPEIYLRQHPEQRGWTQGERYRSMRREAADEARRESRAALAFYAKGLAVSYGDPGAIEYLRLFDLYPRQGRLLNAVVSGGPVAAVRQLVAQRPLAVLVSLVCGLALLLVYWLAALGLWRNLRGPGALLLLLTVGYLALTSGGTVGSARLRMPVMPFLLIFAARGLVALRARRAVRAASHGAFK